MCVSTIMRIKVTLEIELEDHIFNHTEEGERLWFENEVMVGDGTLILHSNDIGDTVGIVKKVKNLVYL